MSDTGAYSSGFVPPQETQGPDALVADLIGRFAPAYLPQVQGLAVQSLAEVVEAEMTKDKLTSADDVLALIYQTAELYRDVAQRAASN